MKKVLWTVVWLLGFSFQILLGEEVLSPIETYPVVILGGGIGGWTSALYLAQGGVTPLIVEGPMPGGMITQAIKMHNWPGEREIAGEDLMNKVQSQVEQYGVRRSSESVVEVDFSSNPFLLTLRSSETGKERKVQASACIIAMGTAPNGLDFLKKTKRENYLGRGISLCALCDGMPYKGKNVAVIGGGDAAIIEAEYLSTIASKVFLIVRKEGFSSLSEPARAERLRKKSNVEILFHSQLEDVVVEGEKVTYLRITDLATNQEKKLGVDGVFLAMGSKPNSALFDRQLRMDREGYIHVEKETYRTSIPKVFAIGDIINRDGKQAVISAGQGASAAIHAKACLPLEKIVAVKAPIQEKNREGIVEIQNQDDWEREISHFSGMVLADFYGTHCSACHRLTPIIDQAAKELHGRIKIVKVDVEKMESLSDSFQISSMPTLIVIDHNQPIYRKIGVEEIATFLRQIKESQRPEKALPEEDSSSEK